MAQRDAIDYTGQLYRFGTEAFEEALSGLKSGFAIELENDTINFVEKRGEELVFRVKGKNTPYALNELPSKVLLAILNVGLDTNEAVDVASRGVFLKLYNSDEEYQLLGQDLIDQAAQKDTKFSRLDDLTHTDYHAN